MKSQMIYFVCKGENNEIIKITKQRKRAENMMTELDISVYSYSLKFYPDIIKLKIGDYLDNFIISEKGVFLWSEFNKKAG